MAQMAVQKVLDSGLDPTKSAANSPDTADVGNGHNTFLDLKNTAGSPVTVTIQSYTELDNGSIAPAATWTLAATTGVLKIPLRQQYDKGDGTGAQITYSSVTGVTSSLVRVQ